MRLARIVLLVTTLVPTVGCGHGYDDSETADWLRIAGKGDESPAEIQCVTDAMHDLLTDEELDQWLAHDPSTITVEVIQSLPHAIDVADRCR